MLTKPLVSVIIPTYNRASFLARAIESVLKQTYKNFEIIVVDDGSTDNTKEILEPLKDKIKYILTENKGPAHARNTGMQVANGKYIAFLDSDDAYLPIKLESQVSFLEKDSEIGMVFSEISATAFNSFYQEYHLRSYWYYWEQWHYEDIFSHKGEFLIDSLEKPITYYIGNLFHYVLLGPLIIPATILFPKKILEVIGFQNETYHMAEDYDFVTRICKDFKVGFINIPTYVQHYHDGQLITSLNKKKNKTKKDILVAIETNKVYLNTVLNQVYSDAEYYNQWKKVLDKRLADIYSMIGVNWLEYGNISEARECFKQSYTFDSKRRRLRIYWWISFFPRFLRKFILRLKNK